MEIQLNERLLQPGNVADDAGVSLKRRATHSKLEVALLTGGFDRPYVFGISMALAAKGVCLDVVGGNGVDGPEMHATPNLNFLNFRDNGRPATSFRERTARLLNYYWRLIGYAAVAKPRIFHILWNNRFQLFDRTILILWYKACGKKVVLTAHNVNEGKRDGTDSLTNRLTLGIQYRLADHIFVHSEQQKKELIEDFGVREMAITVIPFGINNSISDTGLGPAEAKRTLGLNDSHKAMLFFGRIKPYKGLEYLLTAFERIASTDSSFRLIIVGNVQKEDQKYATEIRQMIARSASRESIVTKFEFVPDDETELYFKAADVVVLPYAQIYQSGVLVLAYRFGLPVIATDIGSFREEIVEGQTGLICKPCDAADLADAIERYFASGLFACADKRREIILDFAMARYSWETVSAMTCAIYEDLVTKGLRLRKRNAKRAN